MEMLVSLLFLGFFLSFAFTRVMIVLAKYTKLIDDPRTRKHPAIIHKKPVPRGGGLPIFLSIAISFLIFLPINKVVLAILIAGFLVVVVGLLDDKFDLSPYLRFAANIVSAAIVVSSGVSLPFVTNPFGGILHFPTFSIMGISLALPSILAIVWIVWIMNMLNWSKGVDGQMPGVAAISAIIVGIASLRFSTPDPLNILTSQMAFITAGAAAGFLVYNFYPAKIFPGYSATILGFIIGVLSLLSSVKLATAVLVMGIPTVDGLFTILRRIAAKRSPFWHDKGHLHHLLLDLGLGQRMISVLYWIVSLIFGLIALTVSSQGKLFAIILLVVFVSGIILALKFLTKEEN